jgi:hypothetical protein
MPIFDSSLNVVARIALESNQNGFFRISWPRKEVAPHRHQRHDGQVLIHRRDAVGQRSLDEFVDSPSTSTHPRSAGAGGVFPLNESNQF